MAEIDETNWDGAQAMSDAAASDDPAAAYAAICAGKRDGDPSVQSTWALPHHQHPGDPANADGVRNAMSRLPQTQGLVNESAARNHLQAHMDDIHADESGDTSEGPSESMMSAGPVKHLDLPDEHVLSVDSEKRIIALRVVRYNEVVDHPAYGRMLFLPGAFDPIEPTQVTLRNEHDHPTGKGLSLIKDPVGPVIPFRVSKTQAGDDQLTLARDGVSRGTSPGFSDVPGKPQQKLVNGHPTTVYGPSSAVLAEVSTTWAPTFAGDGVMYMLHSEQKGSGPMAEAQEAPAPGPAITPGIDYTAFAEAIVNAQAKGATESKLDTMLAKFDQLVELQRSNFKVPAGDVRKPKLHNWVEMTLRRMAGEAVSPTVLKELALDDVITSDNPGLVPNLLVPDYNDLITPQRPFLNSTRQIAAPASGTAMLLPIITQRAVAGTQAGNAEKGDLTTTATQVGTGSFNYVPVFGGADISIQMIQRADRSFYDLLTGDMAFAYALDAEQKALAALLAGYTDSASVPHQVAFGGDIDPESPNFGEAWKRSIIAAKRAPTHIWMSAAAVGAFIDAKSPLTNAPLYSNLAADFTAGGGPGGRLSGLIPVYVPAMDANLKVDVIVGPASGFVWAEDPALNLQADVPSKAGRDIALVGGIFPAPRYANAFTKYNLAVS